MTEAFDEDAPLSDEIIVRRAIDHAAAIMVELDNNSEESDRSNMTVTVSADRLYKICESLIVYADSYEGDELDIEAVFDFAEESYARPQTLGSTQIH